MIMIACMHQPSNEKRGEGRGEENEEGKRAEKKRGSLLLAALSMGSMDKGQTCFKPYLL